MSPTSSVADLTASVGREERQQCALEEVVQMAGDALTYGNVGGAISALRSHKRTATHSVHRELLLLYARIHGTSWQQLSESMGCKNTSILMVLYSRHPLFLPRLSNRQIRYQLHRLLV